MIFENQESIQLLNTAIIKSKEKKIDSAYEERLTKACNNPVIDALGMATSYLSEKKKISRDQAAIQIIETLRDLDKIWSDYVMMEGITKIKDLLKNQEH